MCTGYTVQVANMNFVAKSLEIQFGVSLCFGYLIDLPRHTSISFFAIDAERYSILKKASR